MFKCFSGVTFKSRIVLIDIELISYFPLFSYFPLIKDLVVINRVCNNRGKQEIYSISSI